MREMTIRELVERSHALAREKGWWPEEGRGFGEVVALIHSEASEAFEDYRNGRGLNEVYFEAGGKPCGIPIELADILIRVADFCGAAGIDIEHAITIKHQHNSTRPARHGGKLA